MRRAAPAAAPAGVVLGVCSGATAAPAAWLTQRLVDELSAGGAAAGQVALLAGGAALLAGAGRAALHLTGIADAVVEARVRVDTARTLASACGRPAGTGFLDDPAEQDRLLMAARGAHEAPVTLVDSVTTAVAAVTGIATFVVVLARSWPWMLAALFATAVPVALVQRRLGRQMVRTTERAVASYRWSDYYAALFTAPATAREMRLYGAQRLLADRMSGHLATALEAEARQRQRNAVGQIGFTFANAAVAAVGSVAVALAVVRGDVTVGGLVLFAAAVTAVQGNIASLIVTTGELAVNLRVFGRFLDFVATAERSAPGGADRLEPLRDAVELQDVWFRYGPDRPWVLRGVTVRLAAGQTHALVGANGTGKSTLVNLLLRFYEPDRGRILWDGVDIATVAPERLRERLAGVLQEHVAYELSALENVTLGDVRRLGDRAAATDAAGRARVLHTVERLPAGWDTMLSTRRAGEDGTDGVTLSGGQWQRLALARAMLRADADLLVLDEPNAGLDPLAEHRLHTDLLRFGAGRTRLLISHRLGALRHADHIVVLDAGTVRESGTHAELMAAGGLYRELFTVQAEPYQLVRR